jgi:glycosyltransferase involved in cell wall biosynthesis
MVAHSCVLSWWESVKGASAPAEWTRYRDCARHGLLAANQVVAPSQWMASEIERLYRVRPVRVVPNGRDRSAGFAATCEKQPIILGAGRLWDEAKNMRSLDRACARAAWPLYFAGATHGPFDEQFVPANGISLGTLSPQELATWMRQASIYVLPAKYEPFGLSALEAALCGCALVLGDIPSLRENWEDAAVFVDPCDAAALADAIAGLIAVPESRAELGQKARDRARHFTTERMTAGYLAAYAELLEQRGARKPPAAASA